MRIRWTELPFQARNEDEFRRGLSDWLGHVFYEILPAQGYEIREEQIYATFRIAKALGSGRTLLAEAGPGTGKTFAYLLPAVCFARFKGAPVVVASATSLLQAQLTSPGGDIQTLSRLLNLNIQAGVAEDPASYICEMKARWADPEGAPKGWEAFRLWAEQTGTGARSEVPDVPDELWERMAWEPSLACDTCVFRGHCHVMTARRRYREAADLVVCDHRLFSQDLLTRAERLEAGGAPLLPRYSAVVLDEGHHLAEMWQRVQGHKLDPHRLKSTLEQVRGLLKEGPAERTAAMRDLAVAGRRLQAFLRQLKTATEPGEGKRTVDRTEAVLAAAATLDQGLEQVQEVLVTEETMNEGLEAEEVIRAYQVRLDEARASLAALRSAQSLVWVEGGDLWTVPRNPSNLYDPGRLKPGTPVVFSSATLEPEYQARILHLPAPDAFRVGVPFNLAEQALIYLPEEERDPVQEVRALLSASRGRALVLLPTLAEVRRYREALAGGDLPWPLLFEGEGERGSQLNRFRTEVDSVLFGATFWEGVDVPGESLSCCIIPRLPFPEHDPLIRERRQQAEAAGEDPFLAVDLPEMLIRLRQGFGRLIRTAQDRGVIALLDRSFVGQAWAGAVLEALPQGAEQTSSLQAVAAFLAPGGGTAREVASAQQEPVDERRN